MITEFSHLFEEGEGSSEMQINRKEDTSSEFGGIKGQGGDQQQQRTDQSIDMPVLDLANGEPVHRSESPPHPFLQFLGLTSFQRTRTSSQENAPTSLSTYNSTEPEVYHDDHGDHDNRSNMSTLERERSSSLSPLLPKPVLDRDVTVPRSNLIIQRDSDDLEKGETSLDEEENHHRNPTGGPEYIPSETDLAIAPNRVLSKLQSSRSNGMSSSYSPGSTRTADTNDGLSSTDRQRCWSRKAKDKSSRSEGQLSGSSEPAPSGQSSSSRSSERQGTCRLLE